MSGRQLERVARGLGKAMSQSLGNLSAVRKSAVQSFQLWLHQEEEGTSMSNDQG